MRKVYSAICSLLFMLVSVTLFAQGTWTWMSGTSTTSAAAVYGKQGVPSVNNHPAAIYLPSSWTDTQGNFWMYGGELNIISNADLWKFNPSTLEWTWVKGNGSNSVPPVFGTKGIANTNNTPGLRFWSACTWVDAIGNLWLYGGNGYAGAYADMWKYNIASNEWTWVAGSDSANIVPEYGIMGVASPYNNPGSRLQIGSSWVDANGKFWLYGSQGKKGILCDMWMYDPVTNMWTWESGTQALNTLPTYGTKDMFSASNSPGGREPFSMWTDVSGHFYLFGGNGLILDTIYADLWEYDPTINQWAWVDGSQKRRAAGIEGSVCEADTSYFPQARTGNAALWKDKHGNAWMFGGCIGSTNSGTTIANGDLWVYLSTCKEWARVTDSSFTNATPVYGTLGVPSAANMPGARWGPGHWQDTQGNFWIFGGQNGPTTTEAYADMWRYSPDTACAAASCGGCLSSAGTISSTHDSICAGSGVTSQLTSANTSGSLQWQSSPDSVSYSNISGETSNSYTTPLSLTQSIYYRIIANGGSCSDTSVAKKITILSGSLAGTISSQPDTLCTGTIAKLKTTGSIGSIQWQSSAGKSNFKNIAGATDSTVTQIATQTMYYRTIAANGICYDTSALFSLTVIPIPVAVFSASASGLVVTFNSSGSSGGVTSYYWNFGDGDTSDFANPVHVYSKADTFDVCLTVFNKSNCDYTTCQNVETYPTGIEIVFAKNEWNIYPDPFIRDFNIVSASPIRVRSVEVCDVLGKVVLVNKMFNERDNIYKIDASGLANGMYYVRITTAESDYIVPVVKLFVVF